MLFEGWYAVGDLIIIEPFKVEGVVEEVSLRATTIRSVNGESIRVHNSQVLAVRRLPRLVDSERLDENLVRLRARCATAAGREWLAQDFLPDVLKERAGDGLIVHGPVVTEIDVSSEPSKYFARFYGSRAGAGATR
jgi:hypothetical protein